MYIGDGENDVPMFEVERFRVALLASAKELRFMTSTLACYYYGR